MDKRTEAKNKRGKKPIKIKDTICVICNNIFSQKATRSRTTCTPQCKKVLCSNNSRSNPNCGGFHSGKKYSYKEYILDSTWEVEIAQILDTLNFKWTRGKEVMIKYILNDKKRRYYPDFYLPEFNLYIDPKNPFKMLCDNEKMKIVERQINILYGDKEQIKNDLEALFFSTKTI